MGDEIYVGRKAQFGNFPIRKSIIFHNKLVRRPVRFTKGKILKKSYFKDTIEAMCECIYPNSHGPMRMNCKPILLKHKSNKVRVR